MASQASGSSAGLQQPGQGQILEHTYYRSQDEGVSETDTDTSSDYEAPEAAMAEGDGEHLYWAYSQSKAKWRRFTHKPTRKVRRFAKRKGGKGKSGKGASAFMAAEETQAYFKGKGKTTNKSSNKGFTSGER